MQTGSVVVSPALDPYFIPAHSPERALAMCFWSNMAPVLDDLYRRAMRSFYNAIF